MLEGHGETPYAQELLLRAAACTEIRLFDEINAASLARIAKRMGCDFATALLYDRIRRSEEHGPFIRQVQGSRPDLAGCRSLRVIVVPGAFHKEYPHTGADGARLIAPLRKNGFDVSIMPIPSFAPLKQGATHVSEWVAANVASPAVLMSLSKGGAEVKLAFATERTRTWSRHLIGWIDLSGILEGTALVNWLERRHWRWWAIRAGLWARGQSIQTLKELERVEQSTLSNATFIPQGLTAIHVVGFPLVEHLSNRWARRGHRRLAPLGPNDGGGILLADAISRPGLFYPAWGADHYLNPAWDIEELIVRLVSYLQSHIRSH